MRSPFCLATLPLPLLLLLLLPRLAISQLTDDLKARIDELAGREKFVPSRNQEFLRVATYNVKYLEQTGPDIVGLDSIYADLVGLCASIIIFQQIPVLAVAPQRAVLNYLLESVGYVYTCESQAIGGDYGCLIAGIVPFLGCDSIDLGLGRALANTEINYKGTTLDIIGSHFSSLNDAARKAHVLAMADYIRTIGVIQNRLLLGVDTDTTASSILWNLRAVLPVEEVFRIVGWTKPAYSNGTTSAIVDYMLASKNLEASVVGVYVYESVCAPTFPVIVDIY